MLQVKFVHIMENFLIRGKSITKFCAVDAHGVLVPLDGSCTELLYSTSDVSFAVALSLAFGCSRARSGFFNLSSTCPDHHLFSVWYCPEIHPSEKYLECTQTAMSFDALTVGPDVNTQFAKYHRMAAFASQRWFHPIAYCTIFLLSFCNSTFQFSLRSVFDKSRSRASWSQ